MIGFRGILLNETKGTGIMTQSFAGYEPYKGKLQKHNKGAIIASSPGQATAYAIKEFEKLGTFFVKHQSNVNNIKIK
jgi:GTP-binding protein